MNITPQKGITYTLLAVLACAAMTGCGTSRKAQSQGNSIYETLTQSGQASTRQDGASRKNTAWGGTEYSGRPWVENTSRPVEITQGLHNRHVSLWASHGRYYNNKRGSWRWQRPLLFGTCEDLFTQTIVVPYLIPMLENAGAVVFTPRERDWQRNEVIVDNDDTTTLPYYTEINVDGEWQDAGTHGFARHKGSYRDGENPFEAGTARMAKAAKDGKSEISYQPRLPEEGRYAVYVSYPDVGNNVDDARYTVFHKGQKTEFTVNQTMGAGTWVYLGTFDFGKGCSQYNRVVLSNTSSGKGYVGADAVRFGGGMGNIARGGFISGLPRCLECARYYAQWAGAPYDVYCSKGGDNDYGDDINTRALMTNWIGGGSCYMPGKEGKGVPIELSLAVHSDAGVASDGKSLIGSLSICTTDTAYGELSAGISRQNSKTFATMLLENMQTDIRYKYGKWVGREVRDKNYSETRLPGVPSAILETMSHQNFPDMLMGQDPNMRFTVARSIYKTMLKFIAGSHGDDFTVTPLQPQNLSVEFTGEGEVTLKWNGKEDPQEPTARPTSYILYISTGDGGFDNGTKIISTSCKVNLLPGILYNFKVTAVNKGGESFPTETLSAVYHKGATKSVLVINGFNRLSAPAAINAEDMQGFDFNADPGVSYGRTAGWSGRQINFDKRKMGIEDSSGLGYSGTEWQGMFIAGNDFNYVCTHAMAMLPVEECNVSSSSRGAVEAGKVDITKYHCVDLLLGLEKFDGNALVYYKTFTPAMQEVLKEYTGSGGSLLVSGSYIGSDMTASNDARFLRNVLKAEYAGNERMNKDGKIEGMGTSFNIYRTINEKHYAATSPDILKPMEPAYCALTYSDGRPASVAYDGGEYKLFVMGFPFECITSEAKRTAVMRGIMNFLLK